MKTYLKYSIPAIFASMTCLSPNVIAQESDEIEEERISITFNQRTLMVESGSDNFIFSPVSELDIDLSITDNFRGELSFSLNENHNLLGVGDDENGLSRAVLVFESDGFVDQSLEFGLLGHAREFRTSRAGENIGIDSPLSLDYPFREERLNEFAGARYDIDIPFGDNWSVNFNATAGRTLKDSFSLNNYDVLEGLVNGGSPTAPYFRDEAREAINDLFDKASSSTGEYFGDLRTDLDTREFDFNEDRLLDRVDNLASKVSVYDQGLADRLSDEMAQLDLESLENIDPAVLKERLAQTVDMLEGSVNNSLSTYREDVLARLDNVSDDELNELVLLIAKELRDLEIYFHENASIYDQVAAAGFLESNYGDGISNKELAEYLVLLKSERANSDSLSTMFGASLNRQTDTGCFSLGVNAGTLKSDGYGAVDENFASIYVDGCRHLNERVSVSYTGELAYFDNYRHIEDLEYGLLSISSAIRWDPANMPDVSLHGRLGVTADVFLGPSVHGEVGASYMAFNNEHASLELMGAIGYIEPLGVSGNVSDYLDHLDFHSEPTTAISFGIRARF